MSETLATADDLASYLQRGGLDRATCELLLAGASGVVREYCKWSIAEVTETFVVDGSGTGVIAVPTLRLTAVTEIRVFGTVVDTRTYDWSANGLIERPRCPWPRRRGCVAVDATHGWNPVPDAVRAVVLGLAARHYANPDRLTSKTVGGISRTWSASAGELFNDVDLAILSGYRLP